MGRIGADDSLQIGLHSLPHLRRQSLDLAPEFVNVGYFCRPAQSKQRQIETSVGGVLEALPPEPVGLTEGSSREEKSRRRSGRLENRLDDPGVRCQIVVEGNGDGKRVAPGAVPGDAQELRSRDDAVARAEMSNLRRKERGPHRRNELSTGVTGRIIDAVVNERGAELPVRAPRRPHEDQRERLPEDPEDGRAKAPPRGGERSTPLAQ